jgi:hypothetical protein
LSSDSLEDVAETANELFSFCTFVEWKRAIQQMYIDVQANGSVDKERVRGPALQGPLRGRGPVRLTNKMMTEHKTFTTLDRPWCVSVTLAHTNAMSEGRRRKKPVQVVVSESLIGALQNTKWNEALLFYKDGAQMLGSAADDTVRLDGGYEVRNLLVDYFKPNNTADLQPDARIQLNAAYEDDGDDIELKTIGIGHDPMDENDVSTCVDVEVDETSKTMYIGSLFYSIDPDLRDKCQIYVGQNNGKQGAGSVVLKALTSVCASLGFYSIGLLDLSTFVDLSTMPYFGDIGITAYLRALRGYGFYEGMGFFSKTSLKKVSDIVAHQQSILDYHHAIFTTPIGQLRTRLYSDSPLQLWKDGTLESEYKEDNLRCTEEVKGHIEKLGSVWDERSMRSILKEFNALVEPMRPSNHNMYIWALLDKWEHEFTEMAESQESARTDYLFKLHRAARIIATFNLTVSVPSLRSNLKTFAYWTLPSGRSTIGKHLLVMPSDDGESPPKVMEETVDYNFRIN